MTITIRAFVLASILLGPVLIGCSGGTSSASDVDDSPNVFLDSPATAFQMSPNHGGRVTFTVPITFPASPLWKISIGSGEFGSYISYPLIVNGRIFVTAADPNAAYGANLYALDEQTGATIWGPIFIPGTYVESNPTYDNGKVFVTGSETAVLSEFDAATGAAGWSIQLDSSGGGMSPPTAFDGVVYVSGDFGVLYAVDEATGRVLWKQSVLPGGGFGAPAVTSKGVYVTFPCNYYRFDPKTGAPTWHLSLGCEGGGSSPAAVADGLVFVRDSAAGPNGQIRSTSDGSFLSGIWVGPIPAFGDSALYAVGNDGTLSAIDLATNKVLWTFTDPDGMTTAPILVDNYVFEGSAAGTIYALDAQTGAQKWSGNAGASLEPPEPALAIPLVGMAVAEHTLVVPTSQGLTVWSLNAP